MAILNLALSWCLGYRVEASPFEPAMLNIQGTSHHALVKLASMKLKCEDTIREQLISE